MKPPVSAPGGPRLAWAHALAGLVYLLLALQFTFPLWLSPSTSAEGFDDPLLNSYLLDWAQYALTHQLGDFFQATYFWPHQDSFAYGEHLLAPALLALPLRGLVGSAVALHNLSLLQAYFFSALAAYALGWRLFGSSFTGKPGRLAALARIAPAFAIGLAYGFAPYRLAQSNHLQLAHGEFLPVALLGIEGLIAAVREPGDRLDPRRARVWAALLAFGAAGQWLTSWYWAVFSAGVIAMWLLGRLWTLRGAFPPKRLVWFAAPLALAGALALGMAWPTLRLSRSGALFRPIEASVGMSARPGDLLRPRPRYLPTAIFDSSAAAAPELETEAAYAEKSTRRERALFPGMAFAALAFMGAALALSANMRGAVPAATESEMNVGGALRAATPCPTACARLALFITAITLALAFAPNLHFLPVVSQMRVPARWLLPAWMALSILIGFAVHRLIARSGEPAGRRGPVLASALLALAVVESLSAPIKPVTVSVEPGPALRWLAEQPFQTAYLELPLSPLIDNRPLLRATWTRQPLMNGSNGYIPPGHLSTLRRVAKFPDPEAIAELRSLKVRYVLIDTRAVDQIQKLRNTTALQNHTEFFNDYAVVDLGTE